MMASVSVRDRKKKKNTPFSEHYSEKVSLSIEMFFIKKIHIFLTNSCYTDYEKQLIMFVVFLKV